LWLGISSKNFNFNAIEFKDLRIAYSV